jgi:hypothetical protein
MALLIVYKAQGFNPENHQVRRFALKGREITRRLTCANRFQKIDAFLALRQANKCAAIPPKRIADIVSTRQFGRVGPGNDSVA